MATISLGKDYTISGGIDNVSELTITRTGEQLDVTTREGSLPLKYTVAGLQKITLECTILAEASTTYSVGSSVTVTSSGYTGDLIVMSVDRDEPQDGVVTYKLMMTPGTALASPVPV